jgi:hypothetical protein
MPYYLRHRGIQPQMTGVDWDAGRIAVMQLCWHKGSTITFPTRETFAQPFRECGFFEEIIPMWGRTPLNNYLFVFRRPGNNHSSSRMGG